MLSWCETNYGVPEFGISQGPMARSLRERPYERPRRMYTIMSNEDSEAGKKCRWTGLELRGPIKNLSSTLWTFTYLKALYLNDNNLQRIPPDIALLKNLVHLDLSGNKLRSLPAELGDMIHLRELLLNNNAFRLLPCELGRLFLLQTLGISGNPLSPDILNMSTEPHGTTKLLTFLLDNLTVCPRPPDREWIQLLPMQRPRSASSYSVMSYNVLCDKYATRPLYGYCPSWALTWDYRKQALLKEILDNSADIISLQEVETDQYYSFFLPELKRIGYDGIFSPKSRAKTMTETERRFVDGCAIFFHKSKFSLVDQYLIEFNQLAMAHAESQGSEDMLNRVMIRDNIGLAALLEFKDPSLAGMSSVPQHILVSNAHIHWDPEYCDVKLIQTIMLMSELETILLAAQSERGIGVKTRFHGMPGIPLILCGDLNSLPNSGVFEYLVKGTISIDHMDFLGHNYDTFFDATIRSTSTLSSPIGNPELRHPFHMKSSYSQENIGYTNFTYDFKGTIDYIFYSSDFLKPVGILGGVNYEWLKTYKVIGCPNPHFPSDHFPLLCEFELTSQH